jgi:hypothetical protein
MRNTKEKKEKQNCLPESSATAPNATLVVPIAM